MKKLKRTYLAALIIAGLAVISCAKEQESPITGYSTETFEAWIAKNAPDATKHDSGFYYTYYKRDVNWEILPAPIQDTSWLRMSYTGYTMNFDIFESRYEDIAIQLGTWASTTHFCDDYFLYSSSIYGKLCEGLIYAVQDMREGDSIRVYLPLELAYSEWELGYNSGYQNSSVSYLGYPIILDISLTEIVNDPYELELRRLDDWVAKNWGMTENDTVQKGLYYRTLVSNPEGDSIGEDTIAYAWYSSYYPDNWQLITTNIQDTAIYYGYYSSDSTYTSQQLQASNGTAAEDGGYEALYSLITKMRKGEKIEAMALSYLAAGTTGEITSLPEILPYQTQYFIIEAIDDEDDDDDDDE